MLWSKLFIPTLRDSPAEAETASHRLLLRAGYVRQVTAGTYSYLFLAQRSLSKIIRIVREEMDAIGAQEMRMPLLHPAEESIAATARGDLRSYKQLPQIWYQIQTRFRDDPRPKSGLLGARQYLIADSYAFDTDAAGLDAAYQRHYDAYRRIFDRCGLGYLAVGESPSQDFMVESEAGFDSLVRCEKCGYAANREKAAAHPRPPAAPDPAGNLAPQEFHTPGRKTIADVAAFTGLPESSQMKSLVLMANGELMLVLLRGDHQLSETKFAALTGDAAFRPALPDEIRGAFGADPGSLGPVGITKLKIVADGALEGRRNMIAGANRDDYHLRYVTPGEDFQAKFVDLRQIEAGDGCIRCGAALEIRKTIGIGHLDKLGYKCSEAMGLHVTNPDGIEVTPFMGTYGIGIDRILSAVIEIYHDNDGMSLPAAIAPFTVVVTPVNVADGTQSQTAVRIYRACLDLGLDALFDDRDERPGVKFKDADLIGLPFRITVGKKAASGIVELFERRTRKVEDVPVTEAARRIKERL